MLISILRTLVPAVWAAVVATVLGVLPALEPLRETLLSYGDLAVPFIAALITGLWYALWRWLEPKLPGWLVAIVLGSAKAPVYTVGYDSTSREPGEPDYRLHVARIVYDEELDEADKEYQVTGDDEDPEGKHVAQ